MHASGTGMYTLIASGLVVWVWSNEAGGDFAELLHHRDIPRLNLREATEAAVVAGEEADQFELTGEFERKSSSEESA